MIPVLMTRFPDFAATGAAQLPPRPLAEIARQPTFIVAVIVGMVSYALMNLVMTASPIAMIACGHSVSDAALGIQWHIIGMFAPSFVTGALITRYGRTRVMAAGLVLLAVCGVVALAGLTLAHFWIALLLLGVGWNFAYVGATAMVTECHRPNERGKVQGLNDSFVFGLVTIASVAAGWLQHVAGWAAVNWVIFPAVAVALVALFLPALRRPAAPTAA